jgi:streptogramin lyase
MSSRVRFRVFKVLLLSTLAVGAPALLAQTFSEFPVPGGIPSNLAAGPDGKVWFTEPASDKIGRISTAGVVEEFSLPARSHPQGIARGPDGNMWFAEESGAIGRISPSGAITHFAIPDEGFPSANVPFGVAAGPDGNLWFTKPFVSRVGRIGTNGVVSLFELSYDGPFAITPGPDGNVWFTVRAFGESKICRITPAGANQAFGAYGQLSDPAGIAAGPDGNIWFAEGSGSRISRITPSGTITQFSLPAGSLPVGIVAGLEDDLWFTESAGNKIGRITTSGVITEFSIPTRASIPTWIARGPDGNLWFAEEGVGKIGRLTLGPPTGCHADEITLCLNNGRFRVRALWATADGTSGNAQAVGLTSEAGYFTFFSATNVELVVKVLNGCAFNSNYWVFASGLTDVHVFIRVVDVTTGDLKLYESPLGTAFRSIQDTSAFARCP